MSDPIPPTIPAGLHLALNSMQAAIADLRRSVDALQQEVSLARRPDESMQILEEIICAPSGMSQQPVLDHHPLIPLIIGTWDKARLRAQEMLERKGQTATVWPIGWDLQALVMAPSDPASAALILEILPERLNHPKFHATFKMVVSRRDPPPPTMILCCEILPRLDESMRRRLSVYILESGE